MKQNAKVFIVALVLGAVCSFIYCKYFPDSIMGLASDAKVTYFSVGTYNDKTSADIKKNNYPNAIIYNQDGLYKVVIGIYTSREATELMQSYFSDSGVTYTIGEAKVNKDFKTRAAVYDTLIKSSDKETILSINNSLLKLFSEYIN